MILAAKLDAANAKLDKLTATSGVGPMGPTGTGEGQPKPPSAKELADNPGKYEGTKDDPLNPNTHINNQIVIDRFATNEEARVFVGGTYAQWFKADPSAFLRWFKDQYGGNDLNLSGMSPTQKKAFGL